jgi:peptide/nickel transport system permease protein
VAVAVLSPYVVPYPGSITGDVDLVGRLAPPSLSHLFGTDEFGRDIFSRVLYGARISLVAAGLTVGFALLVGVSLGAIAAGVGGAVDEVIMRIADVFLSFPQMVLGIVIAAFLGPSIPNVILALVIAWWPWYTRLVRGVAVSVRQRPFVLAAETIGTSRRAIIFRHILPSSVGPTIVQASLDLGWVILAMSSLSFLGLGAQPPTPEWGLMVATSRAYFLESWWYMFFPGAAITLTVLAFNVLGDGLGDVLNPKSRGQG